MGRWLPNENGVWTRIQRTTKSTRTRSMVTDRRARRARWQIERSGGRNCARPSVRASKQFFACFAQFVKFKFAKLDDTEPSRHQRSRLCASKGAGRKRTRRSAAETTAQIRTLAVGVAYEISRPRVLRPVNAHLARLAIWPGRFLAWLRRLACTACTWSCILISDF